MGLKFDFEGKNLSIHEKAKMLLFARWMAIEYTTSSMNGSSGVWWTEKIQHFEKVVLPNYHKNGSYKSTVDHLTRVDSGEEELVNHCTDCGGVIEMHETLCRSCVDMTLPF